jgi:hypothetical protein
MRVTRKETEMDAILQEEIRQEAAKSGISEAMAWHVVMTRKRQSGRIVTMSAESYNPDQPRDDHGRWTTAGDIAPVGKMNDLAYKHGVTWKGKDYSASNPVVSDAVHRAKLEGLTDPDKIFRRAAVIQSEERAQKETADYYAQLPKVGQTWKPSPYEAPMRVVEVQRDSGGNHNQYQRDLTWSVSTRPLDEAVISHVHYGNGRRASDFVSVSPKGTSDEEAIRVYKEAINTRSAALVSLDRAIASADKYAK